jgi:hypothetical protein
MPEPKTIWQIGAGDAWRNCAEKFLTWGVALIGPGHADFPRVAGNCRFVVEAKAFNEGIESASAQANNYIEQPGIRGNLVVTDGFRDKMYAAGDAPQPIAGANLWNLKQSALSFFDKMGRRSHVSGHGADGSESSQG